MLSWFRKRRAIKSYRRSLGPALLKAFGVQPSYPIERVRKTAEELGLNRDYLYYAYADFCSREDFDAHHAASGHAHDWGQLRHELTSHWGTSDPHQHHHHDAGHHHHDAGHHHHDAGHHDGGGGYDGGGFDGGGHHH